MRSLLQRRPSPSQLLAWSVLWVAIIWTFHRVSTYGYVLWDDNLLIRDNPLLRLPIGPALRAMFGGFYSGDYLPLTLLSYWTEVNVAGFSAQQQHGVNLLLHLANVTLLALWLGYLPRFAAAPPRLAVCAIFALHPVQVETVAWLSERKGLLATTFLFAASLAAKAAERRPGRRWGLTSAYWLSFTCALLAKAHGILLPLWLWASADRHQDWRERCLKHGVPLILGAALACVRLAAYASSVPNLTSAATSPHHLLEWPLTASAALGFYVRTLVWPAHLSIIYLPYAAGSAWLSDTLLGAASLLLFALSVAWRPTRPAAPWLLFAALTLAPVLQLVPRLNFVNDRYLYLPIIGFSAWLIQCGAELCARLGLNKTPIPRYLTCSLIIASYAGLSAKRCAVWSSNLALWSATVKERGDSSLALNNLGQAYQEAHDTGAAIAAYKQSIAAAPLLDHDNSAYNNLAMVYSDASQPATFDLEQATTLLMAGIAAAPRPEEGFILRYNLALTQLQANDLNAARATLQELAADLAKSANQRYLGLAEQTAQLLGRLSQ